MFTRTLIITPHCDDETIGCGGMISKLREEGKVVHILIIATHSDTYSYNLRRKVFNDERLNETYEAMRVLDIPKDCVRQLDGYEDGRLDICSQRDIITDIDNEIRDFQPTAVLFPYSSHHQDHQAVCTASIAALRPTVDTRYIKLKAAYEYPYITTSWNTNMRGDSRLYYPLSEYDIEKKKDALAKYQSQLVRDELDILDISSIIQLNKVRGTEIGYPYAEVLYPISIIA